MLLGEKAHAYDAVLAEFLPQHGIHRKAMFGADAITVGGKGFAMIHRGMLVLKLPRGRVDALVTAGIGAPFDPGMGRPMKEWVAIASHEDQWLALAREAHDFVVAMQMR